MVPINVFSVLFGLAFPGMMIAHSYSQSPAYSRVLRLGAALMPLFLASNALITALGLPQFGALNASVIVTSALVVCAAEVSLFAKTTALPHRAFMWSLRGAIESSPRTRNASSWGVSPSDCAHSARDSGLRLLGSAR